MALKPGRRTQILEAATQVFMAKGYHGATMNDIADAAHMPRGSIHYHISSKQDLLFDVLVDATQQTMARLEALDLHNRRPDDLLRSIIAISLDSDATRFFLFGSEVSAQQLEQLRLQRRRWDKVIGTVLRRGIDEGLFAPVDIPFVVFTLGAINNTWSRAYNDGGRLNREQLAECCFEFVTRGIGYRPSESTPK